ncbi:MAG: GNAT family N-acetyltransferase [Actinomycetota bacterium]
MAEGAMIRAARPGDGEGLARVWVDMSDYYANLNPEHFQLPRNEGLAESFEEDLVKDPPEDAISLVAEVDGRIVGWIWAHILAPREDAHHQLLREVGQPRLVVEALGVERSFWRHGIGTQLMRTVEDWARKKGAVFANVDTYVESPVSVPFYEHGMGYTRRRVTLQKKLTDS